MSTNASVRADVSRFAVFIEGEQDIDRAREALSVRSALFGQEPVPGEDVTVTQEDGGYRYECTVRQRPPVVERLSHG